MIRDELRGRTLYVVAVVSLAAIFLAYQVKTPLVIDLGQNGDEAYINGFHAAERADGLSYRWTSDRSSILIPGAGAYTPVVSHLSLNGSRPPGLALPLVAIRGNGRELGSFIATDQFETYSFSIDRATLGIRGDLAIEIQCETFVPAEVMAGDDLRQLGVMVDCVAVQSQPATVPLVLPPPRQLLYLVLAATAAYVLARQVALSRSVSLAVTGVLLLILAALVVQARLWVTLQCPRIFGLVAIANVAVILARPARHLLTREGAVPDPDKADLQVVLVAILVVAASLYVSLALVSPLREDRATDFFINYTAATVLAQGGNVYDADALRQASETGPSPLTSFNFDSLFVTYITPPFHAILLLPFIPLGYEKARVVFLLLNNLLLFSSVALIVQASRNHLLSLPHCLFALLLVFGLEPIYTSLELGQEDSVILFLIVVSYWAYKSGRKLIVGPCLALAAMIKLIPGVLIIYFLWKKEYSVFISALVTVLLAGALSVVLAGRDAVVLFGTSFLPALLKGSAFCQNQSFNGFFSRLFVDSSLYYSLQEFPTVPQARILSAVGSAGVVAVGAFVTRKRLGGQNFRFDLEFSLALVTALLVSSIAWGHYFTWLLLPFLVLLNPRLAEYLSARQYVSGLAVAFLGYAAIAVPSSLYAMTLHSSSLSEAAQAALTLLLSLRLYGALLLYSTLAYLTMCLRSEPQGSVARCATGGPREVSP